MIRLNRLRKIGWKPMTVVGVFLCIWMGFLWHLLIAMFKPVQSSSSKWGQKFGCCEVYLVVFLNEVSGPEILVVVKCILLFSWMRWVGQFVSGQKADKLMDGVWQAIFQFGCFCFTSVGSLTIFYSRLRKRWSGKYSRKIFKHKSFFVVHEHIWSGFYAHTW